ncbi:hypothetical protein EK599_19150 [Vibrio sp. T187]|uniref:O-antigen ligase family protein n=1 Tax=Vibrio TaxID=662 RepID=UPI0010C98ADB|nr:MULTISPECIES: O-antigen ligase family protein [Vibrio]MBW3697803.1 hypothetical protein [Vibrio sp. T187]
MKANQSRLPAILSATVVCLLITVIWYFVPNPLVVLVLAMIPLGALFVLNKTFWLVILFVAFSFFRIHEAVPQLYPLKIPLLLSLGALSALLWHAFVSKELKMYWHPSLTWLSIFWVLVFVGIIFASNRPEAIKEFKGIYWKIIVMTLAIVWLVTSAKNLGHTSLVIILSGLLIGSIALYNSANGIGMVEGTRVTVGRDIGSMLGDPNDLALALMFPLAFAVSNTITPRLSLLLRVLSAIICILLLMAVIATQSRGGLLGSLTVFGIFAIKVIRSKVLLISVSGVAAMGLYLMAGISGRASGGAAEAGIDASAMGRLYAWEAAFKMATVNPLTGVGLNNFYSNYYYYSPHWDGLNHAVHSTWFGVLAETGFLGLIIFIGLIVTLIRTARGTLALIEKSRVPLDPNLVSSANAVYAGLLGTIVSGTFLTQGFNWPIYILAALIVCVAHISQKACQIENPPERNT